MQENKEAVEAFVEFVNAASYKGKDFQTLTPLTNLTFFCGAGFSKSWDLCYPTGEQLFKLKVESPTPFSQFLHSLGYDTTQPLTPTEFKDVVYQLSMQMKYASIRTRYIDEGNLNLIYKEIAGMIQVQFDSICNIPFVHNYNDKMKLIAKSEDQVNMLSFIAWLQSHTTGDRDLIPEGLRINYITTNYDFLIEGLLDSVLADDDSFLLYNYRGFTPTTTNGMTNPTMVHDHWLVQSLVKLNGGFEIIEGENGNFKIDYRRRAEDEIRKEPPVLMLPNREQDYSNKYFQAIFPKAIRLLQESTSLVIIGSSLPEEDALLRILLRQFAEEKIDSTIKFIFFIDKSNIDQQKDKLTRIYPYLKTDSRYTRIFNYCGTFNGFIAEAKKLTHNYRI